MKYVFNEDGSIKVGKNGHPVMVGDDGKEFEFNAIDASNKINTVTAESNDRRKKLGTAKTEIETLTTANATLQTTVDSIGDDNKAEIETLRTSITEGFQKKLDDQDTVIKGLNDNLFESNVTGKIGISPVIETTVLPKSVFINTFKGQFLADGSATGWDGKPILSKENPSQNAGVNEALTVLVSTHTDSDGMLKGSGAHSGTPEQKKGSESTSTLSSTDNIKAGLAARQK
jgi:hypothetical protein